MLKDVEDVGFRGDLFRSVELTSLVVVVLTIPFDLLLLGVVLIAFPTETSYRTLFTGFFEGDRFRVVAFLGLSASPAEAARLSLAMLMRSCLRRVVRANRQVVVRCFGPDC
jgi:hypothetical protein